MMHATPSTAAWKRCPRTGMRRSPCWRWRSANRVSTLMLSDACAASSWRGLVSPHPVPDAVAPAHGKAMASVVHPYGRRAQGTQATIQKMTREDLREYWARTFARDNLRVVVVGDIDAATLGGVLDTLFGQLPAKAQLTPIVPVQPAAAEKFKVIEMAVPQAGARLRLPACPRTGRRPR